MTALSVVICLTFADLLSFEQVPSRRDLLLFFVPFKVFLADRLRAGHLPLWNPFTFLGTPFLASLQTGVLYPPTGLLLLPFPIGFNLFLLSHYLVALAGSWLFFRFRRLGLAASSIGSIAFVIGGHLVSLLNVTNHLQSAAWIPLTLYVWARYLAAPSVAWVSCLTVLIAVEILGGSAEVVLMTVAILFAWSVPRSLADPKAGSRRMLALAFSAAVAAALTAFQILATAELTAHSLRGAAFSFGQMSFWSLEPISLIQLLLPHSSSLLTTAEQNSVGQILESQVPWISSLYLGLIPLCLGVVGAVRGRERVFWGALALAGVLLALGKHGPLLPYLYDLVPGLFGKFRYPEKFWLLVHLAAAVLCAEGADAVFRGDRQGRRVAVVAASTFIAIGITILAIRWLRPVAFTGFLAVLRGVDLPPLAFTALATDVVFKAQRLVVVLGAFLALLSLRTLGWIRSAVASTAIVALAAADLGGAHYNLNLSMSWPDLMSRRPLVDVEDLRQRHLRTFYYQTVSSPRWGAGSDDIAGLEEGFKAIRNIDDVRAHASAEWPALPGNTGILYGVGTVVGGEAIDRAEIEMLRDVLAVVPRERAVHLLRLFSVGALTGSSELDVPTLELVAREEGHVAYEVSNPLPRAHLVSHLQPAGDLLEAFNRLIAADFEPGRQAVVERLPEGWRNGATNEATGEASITRYDDDRVTVRTRSHRPAFLVLNDSWFPGWEARVDGTNVEILRTNGLVRGVVVPAGEHEVSFEYRPLPFRVGAGISIATGIIFVAWIVLLRRRAPPRMR